MSNNLNTTKVDAFIPEVWSKEIIEATNPKIVLSGLVWRYDSEAKLGDTIHVPSLTNLVANDKVLNVEVSLQAPTESNTDILINKHKETSFVVEDVAKLKANRDFRSLYTDRATTAISKVMDSDLTAFATSFSTSKGTYNTAITTDVILDGIEVLDLLDVPMEDRAFVFRSDVKRDLLDLAAYTSSDYVEGKPVSTGNIGSLYGVQTYESNNIYKTGNNTSNMLFHKQALALAVAQAPRVQMQYLLPHLGAMTVVDTVYGVKVMRATFGVEIKT